MRAKLEEAAHVAAGSQPAQGQTVVIAAGLWHFVSMARQLLQEQFTKNQVVLMGEEEAPMFEGFGPLHEKLRTAGKPALVLAKIISAGWQLLSQ
jgi:hypothetical protein